MTRQSFGGSTVPGHRSSLARFAAGNAKRSRATRAARQRKTLGLGLVALALRGSARLDRGAIERETVMLKLLKWFGERVLLAGPPICLLLIVAVCLGWLWRGSSQEVEAATPIYWNVVPGLKTSNLAISEGWKVTASAAPNWPDGRQMIVTFWNNGSTTVKCVEYYDRDFSGTGEFCYQPEQAE